MTDKSRPYRDRLIAARGHMVHRIRAKDTTGRQAVYFVYVRENREDEFLAAIESDKNLDLEDFGEVLVSSYGDEPSEVAKAYMKEKYGFEI